MPSKSKKQHNYMAFLAHTGTPKQRKVAREFLSADKAAGKFKGKGKKNAKKARKK